MIGRVKVWVICGVLALLLSSLGASTAAAQGFGAGGYGLGFFNYSNNYNINQRTIPYYALYPPVYYSYPVARPYGYSPFAYPPGTLTPPGPNGGAAEFRNPYVPQPSAQPVADQTVSAPRTYLNPFVVNGQTASK